ncbi:MAG: thioredoxin family protein [archaeon]|nr:thioredoxin family protein [archaeon]
MKVTIIGSGCATCERLHSMVKSLVESGKITAKIEYLKDVNELIKRGIMGSPALLVDNKVINIGMPDSSETLLQLINKR